VSSVARVALASAKRSNRVMSGTRDAPSSSNSIASGASIEPPQTAGFPGKERSRPAHLLLVRGGSPPELGEDDSLAVNSIAPVVLPPLWKGQWVVAGV